MADKFVTPCDLPSPREREILTILMEECAEVQQRAAKLLRFGRDEVQPGQPLSNRDRLSEELGDLAAVIAMAATAELVSIPVLQRQEPLKHKNLAKFMQTAATVGGPG